MAGDDDGRVGDRSRVQLPMALSFDLKARQAMEARSLPAVRGLYGELQNAANAAEELQAKGGNACGCDVGIATLRIIVGFALNKLDGEGRYQDWMAAESQNLLTSYQEYLTDCAADAGAAPVTSQLTAQHLKAL